ncbi:MAG TPA: hypothetical protein PK668_12545 [Myxococcota bacterium]|nr:hypothetical protein [Myxococcota bacterium]HRY93701.1 hypothetical protein [Myxococcota bacterium]
MVKQGVLGSLLVVGLIGLAGCEDEGGGCTDRCLSPGLTHCAGTVLQTCGRGAGGCLSWLDTTFCAETGGDCDETDGRAACVAGCTPDCSDKECGQDGCGGECGPGCEPGEACEPETGACAPTCAGSETLNVVFLTAGSEAPLAGIPVAIRCLDQTYEAESDASGRVSFPGLALGQRTFSLTFLQPGSYARSIVGLGGGRPLPDPLVIHRPDDGPAYSWMRGDCSHLEAGSYLWIYGSIWMNYSLTGRYGLNSLYATGQRLVAVEYTSDGSTATPLGFARVDYDWLGTGDGPTIAPEASVLPTATLQLDFELAADSPVKDATLPSDGPDGSNRVLTGVMLWGPLTGFTSSWTGDWTSAVVEVAYVPDALAGRQSAYLDLWDDQSEDWYYRLALPLDPATWTSVTVPDLPAIQGIAPGGTLDMHTPIPVELPAWATQAALQYSIRQVAAGADVYRWAVIVFPEVGSFTLADVAWPSSVPLGDYLPAGADLRMGPTVATWDEDPYAQCKVCWDSVFRDASRTWMVNESYVLLPPP